MDKNHEKMDNHQNCELSNGRNKIRNAPQYDLFFTNINPKIRE